MHNAKESRQKNLKRLRLNFEALDTKHNGGKPESCDAGRRKLVKVTKPTVKGAMFKRKGVLLNRARRVALLNRARRVAG